MKVNCLKKTTVFCYVILLCLILALLSSGGMVFADESSLPNSENIVLDTDITGGYAGDYVLIYNKSEDVYKTQSTGVLSGIDTSVSASMSSRNAAPSSGQRYYHPDDELDLDVDLSLMSMSAQNYSVGDIKTFKILDPLSNGFYHQDFVVKYAGENCYVWSQEAEDPQHPVTDAMAEQVADSFDGFYPEMKDNFGNFVDADGTGKVSLLMYDIQCGNNPSSYIGGFFTSADLLPSINGTQMLHIDTYPSVYSPYGSSASVSKCFSTLVHEFQHLLNFSESQNHMSSWLNEAMSMAAEEMVFPGSSFQSRRSFYDADYSSKITNGHSVLNFDNSLHSYSLSALLAAYLKDQTGDYGVFSRISTSYQQTADEMAALEEALADTPLEDISSSDVLAAYRIALAVNNHSGLYGFNDDNAFSSIKPKVYVKDGTSVDLRGGGAILVKPNNGTFIPEKDAGEDIVFIGITKSDGIKITNKPANNKLLAGETHQLEAMPVIPSDPVIWRSSDAAIAEIDPTTGAITAVTGGATTISAERGGFKDEFELTVEDGSFVKIEKKPSKLTEGKFMELTAEVRPQAKADELLWESTAPTVAAIDKVVDAGGNVVKFKCKVNALAEGTTTIRASLDDGTYDEFELQVTPVGGSTSTAGLITDYSGKTIYVTAEEGLSKIADIVNRQKDSDIIADEMGDGLKGWNIYLKANLELDDWIPIGTATAPFQGAFDGSGYKIVINSIDVSKQLADFLGLFGRIGIDGTVQNVTVNIRGTIGTLGQNTYVGGVAGYNDGKILYPVVVISDTGSITGLAKMGGVCGANTYQIKNAQVTNNGEIVARASPAGGVTGYSSGRRTALIDTATVYNNGLIQSGDDTGAIVGHAQSHKGEYSTIEGNIKVVVSEEKGRLGATGGGTASVGGAVGLVYGPVDVSADISVYLGGYINSAGGAGSTGGCIGEIGGPTLLSIIGGHVSVTKGPNAVIERTQNGSNGVVFGTSLGGGNSEKWVYAVEYDSPLTGFPNDADGQKLDQLTKRIEYPTVTNPAVTIAVTTAKTTPVDQANSGGIFIKQHGIASLKADSIVEDDILDLDTTAQTVGAKAKAAPGYFDFNLDTDGLKITVPAYLATNAIPNLALELQINGQPGRVQATSAAAIANQANGNEAISITSTHGAITGWTVERDANADTDNVESYVNYAPQLNVNPNTNTIKGFTLIENGLYKITAEAKSYANATTKGAVAFVVINATTPGISEPMDIIIKGSRLTTAQTEDWTNLAGSVVRAASPGAVTPRAETVTIQAVNTTVAAYGVQKEAINYEITPSAVDAGSVTFDLSETGRYKITATGAGINGAKTKFINVDVDAPTAPAVKGAIDGKLSRNKKYEVVLPSENLIQSPIHAEYQFTAQGVTPGAVSYAALSAPTVEASTSNSAFLYLKTVDKAANESAPIRYELGNYLFLQVAPSPTAAGIVSGTGIVNGAGAYTSGEAITISAIANSGYRFVKWVNVESGAQFAVTPEYNFTISEDLKLNAVFEGIPPTVNGGSSGGGSRRPAVKEDIVVNQDVVDKGYIYGYIDNTFRPDREISRAEFAAMLDRLLILNGKNGSGPKEAFADTKGCWAEANIGRLASSGIVLGVGENKFDPDKSITREEMAAMLTRALVLDEYSAECSLTDISGSFAETEIAKAFNAGIIKGYQDNTFRPWANITRAESVAMLNRIFLDEENKLKSNVFTDISQGSWCYSDVLRAIATKEIS